MKLSLSALMVCFAAAPAIGGEVPDTTLATLGLGGMTRLSDGDGMRIRGSSSSASAGGGSFVVGQLSYTDDIGMHIAYQSGSFGQHFSFSGAGLNVPSNASQSHYAFANDTLNVPGTIMYPQGYSGSFNGVAGTMASAAGGQSAAMGQ